VASQIGVDPLKVNKGVDRNYVRLGGDFSRVYRMGRWVHKSGYYRLFRPRFELIQKFWGMFGSLILQRPKPQKKAIAGLKVLLPGLSDSDYHKLSRHYFAFLAELMIDMMFNIVTIGIHNWQQHIKVQGVEYLEAALSEKRGVLMPTLHIGEFFHLLAYLAFKTTATGSKQYEYVVIGTVENVSLFSFMTSQNRNVFTITTRDYSEVKDKIIRHLKKNRIIILFHDFSKVTHLHTPFNCGPLNFLKPTPQSLISLHKETRAPIVPAVVLPQSYLNHSVVKFLDPTPIYMQLSSLNENDDRSYHGEISIVLNKMLHPYLRRYPYQWEELASFGGWVRLHHIKVPKNTTWFQLICLMHEKMHELLKNSYSPNRNDEALHNLLDDTQQKIINSMESSSYFFKQNPVKIKYFANSVEQEIINLYSVLKAELKKINELQAVAYIESVILKIQAMM
jgi:lauroyl/myristoyl acyltransferase